MSKNRNTAAPVVVIYDNDAEPTYVVDKVALALETDAKSIIVPVAEWLSLEEALDAGKDHPVTSIIEHAISHKTPLLILAEAPAAALLAELADEDRKIVEYPNVRVEIQAGPIGKALEIAKLQDGSALGFTVDAHYKQWIEESGLPVTHWHRRARGRKAQPANTPVEDPTSVLIDVIVERVVSAIEERLAKLEGRLGAIEESIEALVQKPIIAVPVRKTPVVQRVKRKASA